ncbi:MAG: hypothetical protein ABIH59_02915 [archaeon]
MTNNLKITNIAVTGKMPFEGKLNEKEINRLIMRGELGWMENDEKHPMLSAVIRKENSIKNKQIYFAIWPTGTINIVGITRKKEAEQIYEIVFNEIKNLCPRVLKNVHK